LKTLEEQLDIVSYRGTGLSRRQIAKKVGCDPRTVKRYLENPELVNRPRPAAATPRRTSLVDPYRDQIAAYLTEDPDYRASWIYDRLRSHGYIGGYELVKRVVRVIKGQRQQLAYVRFETEPGQQAQVDFGEFQVTMPDGSIKKYYLFGMVLGYSRKLFATLLERCDLPSFLEAHLQAFAYLGGVPHEILYDRMRNVFLREFCGKTEFTQSLVTLAVHYGFTPRVAPAYAAWVKGKIERPMDYLRESFWRGYAFTRLNAANRDLHAWLAEKEQRVHGTTHERIDVRFEREKPALLALPPQPCDVSLRLSRSVRKDCTISVEGNRYVVPHTLVGKEVTVRLRDQRLRIYNAVADLVAQYEMPPPSEKGRRLSDPRFYAALLADLEMQRRKFGRGKDRGKGRAQAQQKQTISPAAPPYPVDVQPVATPICPTLQVERRSMEVYERLSGGAVGYSTGVVSGLVSLEYDHA
jgi:transposase